MPIRPLHDRILVNPGAVRKETGDETDVGSDDDEAEPIEEHPEDDEYYEDESGEGFVEEV